MNKMSPSAPTQRVALYVRLSPKPEGAVGDNYSIDSQLHEGREKALREYGCADPAVFIDKASGKDLNRPEMDRLRDGIRKRKFDVVIARHLDRWTRDSFDIQLTMRELIKAKCKLEFVSGPGMEDTPAGEFSFTVLAAAAQLERRMLADRSRRCRMQKARDGFVHAGPALYGYRYKGHKFGLRGEYEVYEPEAQVVRRMYAEAGTRKSRYAIARDLNADGIPTSRAGKKYRVDGVELEMLGVWDGSRVTQVLKETAYYGYRVEMGEEVKMPAIVSKPVWDKAHESAALNRATLMGRPSQRYLLAGKVWCGRCEGRVRCRSNGRGKNHQYRCQTMDPATFKRSCFGQACYAHLMEGTVWSALWETLTQPKLLTRVIAEYHKSLMAQPKAKQDAAARKVEKARRAVTHYERIFRDPESPIDYDTRKADLENARRELHAAESSVAVTPVFEMPSAKAIEEMSKQFAKGVDLKDFAHRRGIIERAIDRIIFTGKTVEIHAYVNVSCGSKRSQHVHDATTLTHRIPFVITRLVA